MNNENLLTKYNARRILDENFRTTGSIHSFKNHCIGYLKKGEGEFLCNGKKYSAKAGDLVYIAKGTKYYSVWTGSPEIEFYSINFDFTQPFLFYGYRFQIVENYPCELPDSVMENFESRPLVSLSSLYLMLDDLYKKMEYGEETAAAETIRPAVEYIEKNYNKPISISTLASLCLCSESGLFKQFAAAFGVSPITYKHNIMIQHALDLLSSTDLTVEEISEQLGFSSSNYFRKIFIRNIGKTPKQLRSRNG